MDEIKQAALFDLPGLGEEIQKSLTNQDLKEGQPTDLESSPLTPQVITRKPGVPAQPAPVVPAPTPEEEYKKTLERKQPGQPPEARKPKVKQKPIEQRAPEVGVLHEFFPSILNQDVFYDEENDQHIDSSLTVFEYLKAMGYKRGQWILGPEWRSDNCHKHKQRLLVNYSTGRRYENVDVPICLARSSSTFAIDSILANAADHAAAHSYSPAKPIIALSHPGCRCSIYFMKPANYSSIPDNAPGLPMYADKKSLTKFKKELYERLPDIHVNRWSFIAQKDIDAAIPVESKKNFNIKDSNPEPEGSEYASLMDVIIKTADEVWEEDIRPIKVTQNFMYYQFPGILTPVPQKYIGFQLAKTDKIARIYLTELGHEIIVPIKMLNYLQLVPSKEQADANTFIETDGEYGIILQARDYEDPVCYIPAFEEIMTLEGDYKTLKAIG
jgi:hypothetical protein